MHPGSRPSQCSRRGPSRTWRHSRSTAPPSARVGTAMAAMTSLLACSPRRSYRLVVSRLACPMRSATATSTAEAKQPRHLAHVERSARSGPALDRQRVEATFEVGAAQAEHAADAREAGVRVRGLVVPWRVRCARTRCQGKRYQLPRRMRLNSCFSLSDSASSCSLDAPQP